MLLGALYRQSELHPADYVHAALGVDIRPLKAGTPEHDVIYQYIRNTNEGAIDFETHKVNLFAIRRKGEAEAIAQYSNTPRHALLYHGSSMSNFLGILSQGLRIAPPEAPTTGYMFGKGVYFADALSKAHAYSRSHEQLGSALVLLSEVVLGKSKKLWRANYVENLPSEYQSVHGVGKQGPDPRATLVTPDGVEVPCGQMHEQYDYEPLHPTDHLGKPIEIPAYGFHLNRPRG